MGLLKFIVFLLVLGFINSVNADNLGRLFTSQEERQQLERLRLKKEEPEKILVKEIIIPEESIEYEKEIINRDKIMLKGLVYRSSGKSTAWINESNTFEGDLESQYIQIPDDKINPDQVTVIMPDDSTQVDLKVGEAYLPEPLERDVEITTKSDAE